MAFKFTVKLTYRFRWQNQELEKTFNYITGSLLPSFFFLIFVTASHLLLYVDGTKDLNDRHETDPYRW